MRSCAPRPDFENPINQFCSVPVVERLALIHGTRSLVMKVSYCRLASLGLFAYHGSMANVGSMIVRLYWSSASSAAIVSSPSPKTSPSPASTGST